MSKSNSIFFGLLLFSAALHVLVITAWSVRSTPAVSPYQQPSLLKVALRENNTQQTHSAKKPVKIKQTKKASRPTKRHKHKPVNAKSARQKTQKNHSPATLEKKIKTVETTTMLATATSASQPATVTKAVYPDRQQLTARIQKHLNVQIAYNYWYPNIAVRNAWEGRVKLGLRVQANGELTDIHVINSSGYSILDNAAVKSVRHVAALPEASDWLQGQTIDVILPVIYKLTDS